MVGSERDAAIQAAQGAHCWRIRFVCCGHADGDAYRTDWAEADALRNGYLTTPGGHERAAIVGRCEHPEEGAMSGHHDDSEGYDRRQCRAQYPPSHPTERIIRCHLEAGHPGEHEEADTEVTWINDDDARSAITDQLEAFLGPKPWHSDPGEPCEHPFCLRKDEEARAEAMKELIGAISRSVVEKTKRAAAAGEILEAARAAKATDDRRPAAEAGRADDDGLYLAAARAYRAAYPAAHPEDDLAGVASFHWMRIVVDAVRDAERAKPRVAHDGRDVYEAAARLTLAGLGENDPSDWQPRQGILMSVWSEAVAEAEQREFRDPASDGRLWHVIKAAADESERVTRAPLLAELAEVTRERDEARAKLVGLRIDYGRYEDLCADQSMTMQQLERQRDEALALLAKFADDEPCHLDHHGNCQAHRLDHPPCSVAEARRLTRAVEPVTDDGGAP